MVWMILWGCGSTDAGTDVVREHEVDPPAEQPAALVVYSGRSESLVGPLIPQLEAAIGREIQMQYGSTPDLVTRLLTEGAESPADLIFAQDSGHLGVLTAKNALAALPDDLLQSVDPRFRDPDGHWIGTSGRLRTLVVDGEIPMDERPESLLELAEPRWKDRVGWAPGNGSFQSHVSALRHEWGEDETRKWLAAMKANGAKTYPKNSPQVAAANTGEIAVGWVNHYYLHRLDKEGRRAQNQVFPEAGKVGNVLMVAGVGIRAGSPNEADARKLVAALVSPESQAWFANETFEYPVRPGIPTHGDVTPLADVPLWAVDQRHLADLGPTRKMLQELGLQ